MTISTSDKIKLIIAFGGLILSTIIGLGIREWYSPDIRYEQGDYYISGKNAITYLKIVNYGHSDAEDVIVNARFKTNINDISVENKSLRLIYLSGGIGNEQVVIKIERLVPSYELSMYFSIDNSPQLNDNDAKGFISNIIYKGGKGKTGRPMWKLLLLIPIFVISLIIGGFFGNFIGKRFAREAIKMTEEVLTAQFTSLLGCLFQIIYSIDKEKVPSELIKLLDKIKRDESIGKKENWKENWAELCDICKLISRKNQ